ncbi:MAG: hypothetical protein M0016_03125 [Deltaproteobacteria bacterium]|jgi:predicted patatin/cPLA2 family phospholipase|nr:hypothetical protein [Deltaproteobacteria bacterium]MCL5879711.1 hypothetical protein [Deltaproteobacteria bacterium]MDA8304140.1 hypothetical protein [Deltaproteobacteria bacterium]
MKNNFNLFTLLKPLQNRLGRKQKSYKQIMKEIGRRIKEQDDFEDLYIELMKIKAYGSLKKAGVDIEELQAEAEK